MEKMGIKNLDENLKADYEIEQELNKRQIFINKFIEKFPKANLHTITQINKLYNKNSNKLDY